MQLKSGTRLQSLVCDAQVIVVRAPAGDVDLRCGGEPMAPVDEPVERRPLPADPGEGTLMGKRYADADVGIEILCTKPGKGTLTIGAEPLPLKDAKPLPSSD